MDTNTNVQPAKVKEKPNTRKLAFRQEAMEALLELSSEKELTSEKCLEVAKLDCKLCTLHDASANPKPQNCRDNPYCIKRLGLEKFEKLIKAELSKSEKVKEEQKRRDLNDQPAGLINSGNFCYVNSFLQVWFNVPEFRQIVYDFRPSHNYLSPEYPKMDVQKVMLALQDLFYTLETTPFEDTDKNKFLISALRLNQEQQDAQEFTLMLFDALDRNLQSHPNGADIRFRITNLYTGSIRYNTFCNCGMNSAREDLITSVQLNIAGHSTLFDALRANFAAEELDDYRCPSCNETGNVSRSCEYSHLPQVIIVQLNRYTYDMKGRRKLKTPVVYPRELPSSVFQKANDEQENAEMYDLFAVMIHEGDNTDYGHYYDLVKTPWSSKWFKYNDEKVEAMARPPGTERATSSDGKRVKKSEKAPADQRACYGLLYRRRDEQLPLPRPEHPPPELIGSSADEIEDMFLGMNSETLAKNKKKFDDLRRRFESLSKTLASLETHESNFKNANEVGFVPISLITDILQNEYLRAAEAAGVRKGCAPQNSSKSVVNRNGKDAALENSADLPEAPLDMDIVAIAMTSSELPTVDEKSGMTTRSRNGVSRPRPDYYPRKRVDSSSGGREPPIVAQVAARLQAHSMAVCPHGRLLIDSILFGDVKAVARQPAIKLLRQYGIETKIERDDGNIEYPSSDYAPFIFTGDKLCVECILELRREAQFNIQLEEDERTVKKILKEFKIRCSVKGVHPKDPGDFYVAKIALQNFRKSAVSERQHRLQVQNTNGGELVFETVSRADQGSRTRPNRKRSGTPNEDIDDSSEGFIAEEEGLDDQEDAVLISEPVREYNSKTTLNIPKAKEEFDPSTELPENILEEEEEENLEVKEPPQATFAEREEKNARLESGSSAEDEKTAGKPNEGEETRPPSASNGSCDVPAVAVEFNSELRCIHGGINVDQFRFSVSPEEWKQLKSYFGESFSVLCDEDLCEECFRIDSEALSGTASMRQTIRDLRKRLAETLKEVDKRRGADFFALQLRNENLEFGVCSEFLNRLRRLNSRSSSFLPPICQNCVMCSHGKPCRGISEAAVESNVPSIVPLTRREWETFLNEWRAIQAAQGDCSPNEVTPIKLGKGGTVEELCGKCYQLFLSSQEQAKYEFNNEEVFIRLSNGTLEDDAQFAAMVVKSTRRVSKKNLHKVKISSSSTLLQLKVALYEQTGQTPMEQLLYRNLGGEHFDNSKNSQTLFDLRILPKNVADPMVLISQSTVDTTAKDEEVTETRAPERGFIDTALAH
ncbi:unnamed protein product [Caenorhabditis auriculariae]|uniref:ubiquitinyl hydrolase 1 n=1 Tax=Caenorhabditis auriculariae TaxID=2777116 RepID=A0A8S1GM53_9PELO|nr:unnamed protein product [Caenorhabditis auriculariae]